jgi:hypothetical protein
MDELCVVIGDVLIAFIRLVYLEARTDVAGSGYEPGPREVSRARYGLVNKQAGGEQGWQQAG